MTHEIEVFFDGDCPLCRREIDFLRRRDKLRRIRFVDLADGSFSAPAGRDRVELMARIHCRLPDGRWVVGVEVFRRLYSAVGLGWLVTWSRAPVLRQIVDRAYDLFAANRLRWTRRCADGICRS